MPLTSSTREALSLYFRLGFHIAAQPRGAKAGQGHKPGDRTYVPADSVDRAIGMLRHSNLSVCATRKYGFLDFDGGAELVGGVASALGYPNPWKHITASGKQHWLVQRSAPGVLYDSNAWIECAAGQIDVKGFGVGYVVGPGSATPKGEYSAVVGDHIPIIGPREVAAIKMLLNVKRVAKPTGSLAKAVPVAINGHRRNELTPEEVRDLLARFSPDMRRPEWIGVIAAVRSCCPIGGLAALVEWQRRAVAKAHRDIGKGWHSMKNTKSTAGTLYHLAGVKGKPQAPDRPVLIASQWETDTPEYDYTGVPF